MGKQGRTRSFLTFINLESPPLCWVDSKWMGEVGEEFKVMYVNNPRSGLPNRKPGLKRVALMPPDLKNYLSAPTRGAGCLTGSLNAAFR